MPILKPELGPHRAAYFYSLKPNGLNFQVVSPHERTSQLTDVLRKILGMLLVDRLKGRLFRSS